MKLGLTNVDGDFYKIVEINTIEQLIKLMQEYNEPLIIYENPFYASIFNDAPSDYRKCKYAIEVYDDYRE